MGGEPWSLAGAVLIACNCDYGCPCNFNALPTRGACEGQWTWHVEEGRYGDVALDGLNFTVAVAWPGAIHEGGGRALVLVDERADSAQRQAIKTLVGGHVGGPWGVLAWTWQVVDGPHPVSYDLRIEGVRSSVRAGEHVELELEPIRNPVSGAEVHPSAMLPEGIVFKRGDFASSRTFRVRGRVAFEHPSLYAAVAPFDYSGP